ncbi:MAG: putative glycolipid-binding domain-containing protein [Ilumatobacteraceae bacterium]
MNRYSAPTAAHDPTGHVVRWRTADGQHLETTTIRFENEGYTVTGVVGSERIEYVLRLSSAWQVRQFILFRDLEEPDLWLATDGHGRWGEMNGAHRTELDGCYDIDLRCTPFTHSLAVRRLPLLDGHSAEIPVITIDTETLEVRAEPHRYTCHDSHHWTIGRAEGDIEVELDEHGLVVDQHGWFVRA